MVNSNQKELNSFEKFVKLHINLKKKRHLASDDRYYSDYDALTGFGVIVFIASWIFASFTVASLFLPIVIFTWFLNNIDFKKKKIITDYDSYEYGKDGK